MPIWGTRDVAGILPICLCAAKGQFGPRSFQYCIGKLYAKKRKAWDVCLSITALGNALVARRVCRACQKTTIISVRYFCISADCDKSSQCLNKIGRTWRAVIAFIGHLIGHLDCFCVSDMTWHLSFLLVFMTMTTFLLSLASYPVYMV